MAIIPLIVIILICGIYLRTGFFSILGIGMRRHQTRRTGISVDQPSILLGSILHIRHFPAVHMFRYAFPMVGVPVTHDGPKCSIISVDTGTSSKRGWLQVNAEDHFSRGNNTSGLRAKLEKYLRDQVR